MSDLTEGERKRILAEVLVKFDSAYGKGLSENPDKIKTWFHQIGHLDRETALATADACIGHHKWQPTISEFLETSRSIRKHQEAMAQRSTTVLSEHVKAMQEKGINVQRELLKARAGRKPHDHRQGWEQCPICSQAHAEQNADECRTCFILENQGLTAAHHKG